MKALDELDVKVVQSSVVTIRMESDSIADDMEDSADRRCVGINFDGNGYAS